MREVDQALSRAYSLRVATGPTSVSQTVRRVPARPPAMSDPVFDRGARVTLEWPAIVLTLERLYGDRFAALAGSLAEARVRRNARVVLFTSCHRAEGRTTLVLNVARALARTPGRTVLVDADLTCPVHARLLGLRPAVGLDDVVEQNVAVDDALVEAAGDRLHLLPLRAAAADPKAFLARPAWAGLVTRLRREFDHVLVDGSPLFSGLTAAARYRSVDAAVLVHNPIVTTRHALGRSRDALAAAGIPLLGLAETFAA